MTPEELAHWIEFGDRSKGIPAEWLAAAAIALRELAAWRDGRWSGDFPVDEERATDAALARCERMP